MHDAFARGARLAQSGDAQVIIATHLPILLGCPGARIVNFDTSALSDITYEETAPYASPSSS